MGRFPTRRYSDKIHGLGANIRVFQSGQICMATERVLVHRSIHDKFVEALKKITAETFDSDSESMMLALPAGADKNQNLIKDAMSKGGKLLYGDVNAISKHRMRPVIVGGVKKGMDLYYTESFGPSVSIIPFDTDEEAIKIANDTEYGLSGSVFTENLARGLKIAKQIETGAVHINKMTVHDEAYLPHGGAKKSGWGRFNAQNGIDEFLRSKIITFQE
jgi:acyl-CoA reductase-like NAD-dependent aldehyde dehydrogenase